jgi:ABC-2 type transport system permease protein
MSIVAVERAKADALVARARMFLIEMRKLGAFLRRDFVTAMSYKAAFVGDWIGLAVTGLMFYFTGHLVDAGKLPVYNGHRSSYFEFVLIGMVLGAFVQIALNRVAAVMRQEQFGGTLESLLMTPTASFTVQFGSVMYDLIFVPVRLVIFITVFALLFGVNLDVGGIPQAFIYLLAIVPFIWGLGLITAGLTMTIRKGAAFVGLGVAFLMLGSGAFFPVGVLPGPLASTAQGNPLALAMTGIREALIGGAGWGHMGHDLAILVPAAILALLVGNLAFRVGVRRERRRGTLGLY